MNVFDLALWTALALLLARLENTGNAQLWLVFGAVTGITILNKYGVLFFLIALLAGMAATHWRKWFANIWFWSGALLAVAIALPNFLWQLRRHFPFLELMHNIRRAAAMSRVRRWDFSWINCRSSIQFRCWL